MAGEIRRARPDEAAMVAETVDAAYREYVERIGRKPAPMLASYPDLIERGVVFVLVEGDRVQGVLVLIPGDDYLRLENIAVHPELQGQGLGRRMMTFVEDRARMAGLLEVRLYTNELMTENRDFYGRLGYEETDRREVDGFRRVFMRKQLTRSPFRP
jgi:ribosomal protein S18 acetylase RimI-like enzyme